MTATPLEHLDVPGRRARQRNLEQLARLVAAIELDPLHTAASKTLDGWPARTPASGEPGGGTGGPPQIPARVTDRGVVIGSTRQHLTGFDRALQRAHQALTEMLHHQAAIVRVAPYQEDDPSTPPDGACHVMWKVGVFEPQHTTNPTDVSGTLPYPVIICRPVYDFVRGRGRLPSEDECGFYRDKGRWPVQHVDTRSKGRRKRQR